MTVTHSTLPQKAICSLLPLLALITACVGTSSPPVTSTASRPGETIASTVYPATPSPSRSPATTPLPSHTFTPGISIQSETPAPALTTTPSQTASLTGVTPFSHPTPAGDRTGYSIQAVLDYQGHSLEVEEQVTYFNTTPVSLDALPLVVEARRYPHVFQLVAVQDSAGKRFSEFQWKDTLLTLAFPQELASGDSTRFTLFYTLQLPDLDMLSYTRPHPLGFNRQQTNFGDWYPFVPPFQPGKGWLAHPPAMYGEHLVYDSADFQVAIRVVNAQPGLVIAASAASVQDGEWLRFEHLAARNFAWSASPYYQTAIQDVTLATGEIVSVSSYYFAFHEAAGRALLEAMLQAVVLYSNLFGAYPHPTLAGVQAGFIDGMEYDGLFFLSTDFYNWFKDPPADFLVALTAHEVAHQWWLGLVSSDQALEPWLDEALCTYSEVLFYEELYPAALDWWWEYRVNYYQPAGWVDISIYDVPQEFGYYRRYRDPVYLRGALFLQELRSIMGDSAFFAAFHQYAEQYAYRQAASDGFLDVIHQHTDADLQPLLEKYFLKEP